MLSPDSTRFPLSEDLDFHERNLSERVEVEVVLGDLGPHLEQAFLDRIELWNLDAGMLVEELEPPAADEPEEGSGLEHVLRLCYRAAWDHNQQQAKHWVDFPKFSDADSQDFRRAPRDLRGELPVVLVNTSGIALSLGGRGDLRQLIDSAQQKDFADSLDQLMSGVEGLAAKLVESEDLAGALGRIIDPLRVPLGLGTRPAPEIIRFVPEGGSLSGILRGLQPSLKLRDELGFLPLQRHGSTLTGLIQAARALARNDVEGAVTIVDDYGEGLDLNAAVHLAGTLRSHSGQLWLSTRLGALGQCFRPEETIRLTVKSDGTRAAYTGHKATTKSERIAARHLQLQLLPAVSAKSVAIVEGPHDRAALNAAETKLHAEEGLTLLAAQRITILDAAAIDRSGGNSAIPRLAKLARSLGFHVITVIDWDNNATAAEQCLQENVANADVVIRWPKGYAIERAILNGLSDELIRTALKEVSEGLFVTLDFDPKLLAGADLVKRTSKLLKSSGGLHGPFIEVLPSGSLSPLVRRCLDEIRLAIAKSGHVQL